MTGQPGLQREFQGSQDFTEMGEPVLLWRTIQHGLNTSAVKMAAAALTFPL